ncbi:Rossmann-like and DUF2520 domain-containing protein [Jiulongibacter sediminis]|uniref:DUF2520 domain-containing protein n=1 Tax=Jiulongibacter sediminis TaxID=1605367 RepID=A0A0P7C6F2_9BACT|nr:Rossmann-like and DUF2520 domain-containing protein [Jiulongibacter sediminis]KPM47873.1 hypothetical protein AFM12_11590 [Jiulongibacter sediminis]TBX24057.1 hypothetical protein TK44_11600 [Jiulongibacter sediminis]
MNISIIGTGNIAWHFIQVFEENDLNVAEVFARKKRKAADMQGYAYDVAVQTNLDFSNSTSKVFFLAVSDDAIVQVASEIRLPKEAILVHTSGAKTLGELSVALERNPEVKMGVFYPLMTFTRGVPVDFRKVPICIEGEDEYTLSILRGIAQKISGNVSEITSHQRLVLHVAAVFGCNFVNHLWALSKEIVEEEEIDFEILKPLISETFQKAMKAEHPAQVQTGPAVRDDESTIEKHKKLVKEDPDLLKVYKTLTQSIQDWHQ